MAAPESPTQGLRLKITLVYSPAPRQVREWAIEIESGATVCQALVGCGVFDDFPGLEKNCLLAGIWGQKIRLDHLLADNDRIEIYRPLRVDPKTARRERFDRQGTKSAGLFINKRLGAKAGY